MFWKNIFQHYKITHYFKLFLFKYFLNLTMFHLTNCYILKTISNLTILQITNCVFQFWPKKYFLTLQNYTLLQTFFVLNIFSTLQYYILQAVIFNFCFIQSYNITHYCQKNLKRYFSTLQYYTLLQTVSFSFFFNLTILHITVKKIWKNIFQHYKITHYFKLFLFYIFL